MVDSINSEQNNISLTYFNIPLWYEQTKVNDEVINFLEHIKNQREQLLFSYELSQRLAIWLSVSWIVKFLFPTENENKPVFI